MENPVTRLWKRVNKFGPNHPELGRCWVWVGPPSVKGYGFIWVNRKQMYVHRYSWLIHYGSIGNNKLRVLHKCDNRLCVNPLHLFLGTDDDNSKDMVNKGRQCRGENTKQSKLTEELVVYARKKYIKFCTKYGAKALSKRLGVNQQTMIDAIRGVNWKHVKDGLPVT